MKIDISSYWLDFILSVIYIISKSAQKLYPKKIFIKFLFSPLVTLVNLPKHKTINKIS